MPRTVARDNLDCLTSALQVHTGLLQKLQLEYCYT